MVTTKKSPFEYPIAIRFRGTYDYDGLMGLLESFFYRNLFDSMSPDKIKYKTGKTGAEAEFRFKGDRKITHYIKAYLTIEGKMWDVARYEKEINGVKKTVTDGKFEIKLSGEFELDYAGGFKDDKSLDKWMQRQLDADLTGLQFLDNKANSKSFMEKLLLSLAKQIKSYVGMECY